MLTTSKAAALNNLVQALVESTQSGLFDGEFLSECPPEVINQFCDAASRLIDPAINPDKVETT